MKKFLFVCENDLSNQSTKHRVLDIIEHTGIKDYTIFCGRKVKLGKSEVMLVSFPDLIRIVSGLREFDVLFIQRTSTIFIYWICLMARFLKTEIVFDVDDAIFIKKVRGFKNPLYAYYNKIAKKSSYVFAGSHYIYDYTKPFNQNTYLIPTAYNSKIFDAAKVDKANGQMNTFTIGWLGAGETHLENLRLIRKPLEVLAKNYPIKFKMVSSLGSLKIKNEFENIENLDVDFGKTQWMPLEDIPKEMGDFDVSIMPLLDTPFMRGKCSLKAVESMALKIPVVISGVGENNYLIEHGENGYIANNEEDWIDSIEKLIKNAHERVRVAENGYRTVIENYSIEVVTGKIKEILGL